MSRFLFTADYCRVTMNEHSGFAIINYRGRKDRGDEEGGVRFYLEDGCAVIVNSSDNRVLNVVSGNFTFKDLDNKGKGY
jgi:predicted dithiol-disulfide oxidoreductase (DUF899 family)